MTITPFTALWNNGTELSPTRCERFPFRVRHVYAKGDTHTPQTHTHTHTHAYERLAHTVIPRARKHGTLRR